MLVSHKWNVSSLDQRMEMLRSGEMKLATPPVIPVAHDPNFDWEEAQRAQKRAQAMAAIERELQKQATADAEAKAKAHREWCNSSPLTQFLTR